MTGATVAGRKKKGIIFSHLYAVLFSNFHSYKPSGRF